MDYPEETFEAQGEHVNSTHLGQRWDLNPNLKGARQIRWPLSLCACVDKKLFFNSNNNKLHTTNTKQMSWYNGSQSVVQEA